MLASPQKVSLKPWPDTPVGAIFITKVAAKDEPIVALHGKFQEVDLLIELPKRTEDVTTSAVYHQRALIEDALALDVTDDYTLHVLLETADIAFLEPQHVKAGDAVVYEEVLYLCAQDSAGKGPKLFVNLATGQGREFHVAILCSLRKWALGLPALPGD